MGERRHRRSIDVRGFDAVAAVERRNRARGADDREIGAHSLDARLDRQRRRPAQDVAADDHARQSCASRGDACRSASVAPA